MESVNDTKKYYLGLDVGTNSVGWAVLDENYNLVKKNGYTLWGSRLFKECSDAKARRLNRCGKRRIIRRRQRIEWLREIFAPEISKIDNTFFERLDDSFYKIEDKRNANYYNLFIDGYTDKDFYNEYPTIFHLRRKLITADEKMDIRFIYLAVHNIIKYRGNFLTPGDEFKTNDFSLIEGFFPMLNEILINMNEEFSDDEDYQEDFFAQVSITDNLFVKLQKIMTEKMTITDKKNQLKELFDVPTKSIVNEFVIPLLLGGVVNVSTKLSLVKNKKYEKCEISLDQEDLEAFIDEKEAIIPELSELFDFCSSIKAVVDYFYIIKLLKDSNSTLSDAMIRKYDEHQDDLKRLKEFIKAYLPNCYNECFRTLNDKVNNYASYIGMNKPSGKSKFSRSCHCKREDFYKYLESLFKKIDDPDANDDIVYFRDKMNDNEFLLRQNSSQNGALPMQLHLYELKQILKNQAKYYPFLTEADSSGVTNIDKIIKIFKYKLPYYVGPLNTKSDYSWVERTDEKITPWNFERVVDLDATATRFITRMQNKCTYLKGENDYCLPKNSLVFSEYNCLSYLNKVNIDGKLLDVNTKKAIFENVFLKKKKPTKKDIISYLQSEFGNNSITTSKAKELEEVNCDMSSYIFFKDLFKDDFESKKDMIENIIRDVVIFEDKERLGKRLYEVYGLDTEKVKKIKGLNYKGYGRLSMRLLNGLKLPNPETGEINSTVLDVMRETNLNLQEIMHHNIYKLIDRIDEYNAEFLNTEEMTLEKFIDENITISPLMKRPLFQSIKIIDEVEKILKHPIDKYFIECTRTNKAEKKRTDSRYKKIKEMYAKCKDLSAEFNINMKELNKQLDDNQDSLRSDAIFLYFMQLGKCLYTMENIDFSRLSKDYDIDHIYPQSLIKDDSISNRVLTLKSFNNDIKSDRALFEISDKMPKERFKYYNMLLKYDLISKEKYKRLTKKEFTSDELEGFVNRQLVVTNQAVKGLIEVLKMYKKVDPSKIVFSKAENVKLFRETFDIPKSRTANNFHHAHDAYLNVVVGDIINNYFIGNHFNGYIDYQRLRNESKTINPKTMFKWNKIYSNGKVIWEKESGIAKVKKDILERYDVHITRKIEYSNDMYGKISIRKAGVGNVPCKTTTPLSDISKYGGIESNSYTFYVIVKNIGKKDKIEYILEPIPKRYEKNIDEYLRTVGYKNFEIVCNKIFNGVVVEEGALKYVVTGVTGNSFYFMNLRERFFDVKSIITIKKIDKYIDNIKNERKMIIDDDKIYLTLESDNQKQRYLTKEEMLDLLANVKKIFSRPIYSYSIVKAICEKLVNYEGMELDNLVVLANQLLQLLKTNEKKSANLELIGLSKNSGILLRNKKLSDGMRFIAESPTGYYKKVLFEVPE